MSFNGIESSKEIYIIGLTIIFVSQYGRCLSVYSVTFRETLYRVYCTMGLKIVISMCVEVICMGYQSAWGDNDNLDNICTLIELSEY